MGRESGNRLIRKVFNIDITERGQCKKTNVKIIACITDPAVIQKILAYLDKQDSPITASSSRAPPHRDKAKITIIDDHTIQRDFDFGA